VFASPRHPYTRLLLASIPRLSDVPKSVLAVIPGRVPTPAEFGPGCRFAGRCPLAVARCEAETPPLLGIGNGRATACWRWQEV
jgi:oligopeptide/dipeptide ABC transporter ATP-binding protein